MPKNRSRKKQLSSSRFALMGKLVSWKKIKSEHIINILPSKTKPRHKIRLILGFNNLSTSGLNYSLIRIRTKFPRLLYFVPWNALTRNVVNATAQWSSNLLHLKERKVVDRPLGTIKFECRAHISRVNLLTSWNLIMTPRTTFYVVYQHYRVKTTTES